MDCLEFRRLLGSDPRVGDAVARVHLDACPACSGARAQAQVFESRLTTAMAIPIPDGMADRILLAQLTDTRRQTRVHRRRSTWIALAAAACVALVIGAVRLQSVTMAFPSMVAAHVVAPEERSAWEKRTPVPVASIEQAFADRGMRLAYVPRDIAYVHECDIGPYRGVHMVMPEGNAPVSVIYVVDHHVFFGRDFRRDGLEGREVPIATGTLVMLAASKDRFDAIEHTWRDAIEGPAQIAAGSL